MWKLSYTNDSWILLQHPGISVSGDCIDFDIGQTENLVERGIT